MSMFEDTPLIDGEQDRRTSCETDRLLPSTPPLSPSASLFTPPPSHDKTPAASAFALGPPYAHLPGSAYTCTMPQSPSLSHPQPPMPPNTPVNGSSSAVFTLPDFTPLFLSSSPLSTPCPPSRSKMCLRLSEYTNVDGSEEALDSSTDWLLADL